MSTSEAIAGAVLIGVGFLSMLFLLDPLIMSLVDKLDRIRKGKAGTWKN